MQKHAIHTTELPKKNPQARSCKEKHVKLFSKIYVSWTNLYFFVRKSNFLFPLSYHLNVIFLCRTFPAKLYIQVEWNNVQRFQSFLNPFRTNKSGSTYIWKVFNYDFVVFCAVIVIQTFLFRLLWDFIDFKQQKTKFVDCILFFVEFFRIHYASKEHDRNKTIENR